MNDAVFPSGRRLRRRRPPRGQVLLRTSAVALLCAVFPQLAGPDGTVPGGPGHAMRAAAVPGPQVPAMPGPQLPAAPGPQVPAAPGPHAWMLDPTPALGTAARGLGQAVPLSAALVRPLAPAITPPTTLAVVTPPRAEPGPRMTVPERVAQRIPLPVPRPAGLVAQAESPRLALRAAPALRSLAARRTQTARVEAAAEAERSFFDTVFGARPEPEPAAPRTTLAYASADPSLDPGPRRALERAPAVGAGTAVYDITAQTVTLPSGERLEAHSGLGEAQDNPRHVHRRMRGATPPGTYDLTEREALFHGVRAIRLNPVGGSAAIHGRDGILAHTYMLGPSGASNGCVVFREYPRFLQAFLRGEVRRLVVVAGGRGDAGPSFAENLFGRATR